MEEKKYRLKYLYLINIDDALSTIKESKEYKNFCSSESTALFHRIFDVIFSASSMYNKFLDYQNPYFNNFLGIPSQEDLYRKRLILLKLCLRNHCILHGFFSSLHKECNNSDYSSLTAPYDLWNKMGYYESHHKTSKDFRIDSKLDIYQNYYSTYQKRFNENVIEGKYSTHIITNCEKIDKNNKHVIPPYLRNPLTLLYKNFKFATIDRLLQNISPSKNFLAHYSDLFSVCTEYEKKYNNINDQFLIHNFFEYAYGFHVLRHICKILTEINLSASSFSETIQPKDLEGEALNNILTSFMRCPLVYSRSFLLDLTYKTILASDLSKAYLEHDANVRISYADTDIFTDDKIKKTLRALSLMDDFIKTINNYTIPLLEDLWDVIISEINNNASKNNSETNDDSSKNNSEINSNPKKLIVNLSDYERYLNKYRNILTLDYSCLTDSDINECIDLIIKESSHSEFQDETFNIGLHKTFSLSTLEEKLGSPSEELLELDKQQIYIYLYGEAPSKYVKDSLQTIIKHSLTLSRFNKDINNSLFSKSSDIDFSKSEQFKLNHAKELYNLYL